MKSTKSTKKLTEFETKKILKKYGIPVTREYLAKTPEGAKEFAEKIGYPVALKIQSPDIVHKTEAGGVLLNLVELEQDYIRHILQLTGGVRTRAAEILGIDRASLWRKMKKYGLE